MYRFPRDLYTDVRIETVFQTNITLENFELKQNKVKKDTGAMIRIFEQPLPWCSHEDEGGKSIEN